MEPLTLVIENEEAYLDLIADCFSIGVHEPNQFATPNEDGNALSDMWSPLPEDALYKYLGCYTTQHLPGEKIGEDGDWEYWQETAIEAAEEKAGELVRENMKLQYDHLHLLVPKPEDYPILIHWHWLDSWDRCGDIKERYFMWYSLNKIPRISDSTNPVNTRKTQWENQFGELRDKLLAAAIA